MADSSNLITQMSGVQGGTPDGEPTSIDPEQDAIVRRSLELENAAAVVLAEKGYRIQQNPNTQEIAEARRLFRDAGGPTKEPDYLIEGRVFDCYAPTPTKPVRGIASVAEEKVVKGQTQRVLINLHDWEGDFGAPRKQFEDWPIDSLKEAKVLTRDGDIIQLVPGPHAD